MDTLSNLLGDNGLNTNTIIIILIVLIIIFGYGNTKVCGFNFGCFNPANVSPEGVSPEALDRGPCCYPCNYQCNNSLWIILLAIFFLFFCKKDKCECC